MVAYSVIIQFEISQTKYLMYWEFGTIFEPRDETGVTACSDHLEK